MRVPVFEMERWQSVWENRVELNISESGVHPLTAEELVEDSEALQRLLSVQLGYPQTNGSEELRGRIAALYPGARAENVLVTCGCAEANYIVTWALVEPGDEVVFMQPNYMQVTGVAESFGARVKPLWLREELRWGPELEALERLLTPQTRLVVICNPNNPTGAVLEEKAIEGICAAAAKVGAWVLADEVYRGAEFATGETPVPPNPEPAMTASFWGRYERVLCTGGLSKAYGLPGLRTGWMVGPAKQIEWLWGYHDYTSIGPTMLGERLAALALEPARHARLRARTRKILQKNYPAVHAWVARHDGLLTHVPPAAGAIAWVGWRGRQKTAELAETLRERKSVLVVPGEQMGLASYLRIGFGGDAGQLTQALARVDELLAELG
ncbi:MAG: aminotransferase class I/II-fold pyridoxal phosphate-dependent enzyme [Terriglobia bacterium]